MSKHKENCCPICGAEDLAYGVAEIEDDCVIYPWECHNCDASGDECHDMRFTGHENIERND